MREEIDAGARRRASGRGLRPRTLGRASSRCASRCARLFGLDPDRARAGGLDAAREFEERAGLLGARLPAADPARAAHPLAADGRPARRLDALIYAEIDRRRAAGERGEDILSLLLDATDERRRAAVRAPHPRRGHDAAVRGPRHDDLDGRLPVPRARAPDLLNDPAFDLAGHRRDAAPLPAGLDRPAPLDRAVRLRRASGPRRRAGQLLLVGEPPAARTCGTSPRRSGPSASRPTQPRAHPEGRLRPVRRRLADLPSACASACSRSASSPHAILERFHLELVPGYGPADPPDADDRPEGRDACHRPADRGRTGRPARPRRVAALSRRPRWSADVPPATGSATTRQRDVRCWRRGPQNHPLSRHNVFTKSRQRRRPQRERPGVRRHRQPTRRRRRTRRSRTRREPASRRRPPMNPPRGGGLKYGMPYREARDTSAAGVPVRTDTRIRRNSETLYATEVTQHHVRASRHHRTGSRSPRTRRPGAGAARGGSGSPRRRGRHGPRHRRRPAPCLRRRLLARARRRPALGRRRAPASSSSRSPATSRCCGSSASRATPRMGLRAERRRSRSAAPPPRACCPPAASAARR